MPPGLAFGEEFPEDFMEMTCQPPSKVLRQSGWQGSRDGYHPVVFSFAPVFWEDDFKGEGRLTDDGAELPLALPAQVPGRGLHRRGRRLVQGGVRSRDVREPGGEPLHLQPPTRRPAHQPLPAHRGDLVRRLRGLAQGHRREGRAVHQAGLGHVGRSSPSSSPSRTSWGSSSSTGPSPTTCSSGGATSPRDDRGASVTERGSDDARPRMEECDQERDGPGMSRASFVRPVSRGRSGLSARRRWESGPTRPS